MTQAEESDLVERLNARAPYYEEWARDIRAMNGTSVDADHADATARELREAAAEIARLRGEVEANAGGMLQFKSQRDASRAAIEALVGAAERITRELDVWARDAPDTKRWESFDDKTAFTLGDLRALSRAVEDARRGKYPYRRSPQMSETMTPASVVRQMRDMAQFKGDSLSPDDVERNCTRAADTLDSMQAALADILGLLDDPTGGNHVEDMRAASIRARQALGLPDPTEG